MTHWRKEVSPRFFPAGLGAVLQHATRMLHVAAACACAIEALCRDAFDLIL